MFGLEVLKDMRRGYSLGGRCTEMVGKYQGEDCFMKVVDVLLHKEVETEINVYKKLQDL